MVYPFLMRGVTLIPQPSRLTTGLFLVTGPISRWKVWKNGGVPQPEELGRKIGATRFCAAPVIPLEDGFGSMERLANNPAKRLQAQRHCGLSTWMNEFVTPGLTTATRVAPGSIENQ